jgi:hypothetical protein
LWKWNSPIGISAISISSPVSSSEPSPRASRGPAPSSRCANQRRARPLSCSATIAVTAAKDSWKLAHVRAAAHRRQRLGPEQQHDQRADPDQPQRHRLAPQRQRAEHEQRGDARADRRHLRPGEQGIADRRRRARAGGDQRQSRVEREPRAERQQPQHQQHRRADHRGDVEAADRQQMRQAGTAHRLRIVLGDGALVAGGEARRYRSAGPRDAPLDMRRQRAPQVAAGCLARPEHRHRREAAPRRADAVEPRDARIVIGPRHRRAGRGHQPRLQPHHRAAPEAGRHVRLGEVDAHARRQPLPRGRQEAHADQLARRQGLDPLDRRRQRDDRRPG